MSNDETVSREGREAMTALVAAIEAEVEAGRSRRDPSKKLLEAKARLVKALGGRPRD